MPFREYPYFGHHKYVPIPIHSQQYKGKSKKKKGKKSPSSAAYTHTAFYYEADLSSCSRTFENIRSIACRTLHILCFSVLMLLYIKMRGASEKERHNLIIVQRFARSLCVVFIFVCCLG